MKLKEFLIDGKNFSNLKGFYEEVEKSLTMETKDFTMGRNLNAFNDILSGGFGKFEYEESIILIWKNLEKSKKDLTSDEIKRIIKIIESHKDHIKFIHD